jgi:hypothetical protein
LNLIHFAEGTAEAMMAGQPGFFDLSDRYEALSAAGDPLEHLAAVVDFEVFRGPLVSALRRSVRGKGGRPPFDPVLMFKIRKRCSQATAVHGMSSPTLFAG